MTTLIGQFNKWPVHFKTGIVKSIKNSIAMQFVNENSSEFINELRVFIYIYIQMYVVCAGQLR